MRISPAARLVTTRKTSSGRQRANEFRSYLDAEKRPYVHLLDGGLSDNIDMRVVLENTAYVGDLESTFKSLGVKKIRKLVYLMVSAETTPDANQYKLNDIPGLMQVSHALIDIPINRYSTDTFELVSQAVAQWRAQLRRQPQDDKSVFAPDADIYFVNASFSELKDPEEEARLMRIPTNLSLTDVDLDHLLLAASRLIRKNTEFQRLLRDLEAEAVPNPSTTQATGQSTVPDVVSPSRLP